jgi:CheY-like chemotaxis protein
MADLSHIRRLLVLEDEALILLDLEQTLAEAGVETVLLAANNEDALAIVEGADLDAAILDVNLGRGGRSYDVARRLKQKGVPIVFSSGANEIADGFHDVPLVLKPFSTEQLVNTLRNACSERDTAAA